MENPNPLQQGNPTEGGVTPKGRRGAGVVWFGIFIGILTASSTAAGTTVTLLGLIFTLAGGSFLAWYEPDALKEDRYRTELIHLLAGVGAGGVVGLLMGFGLQFAREYCVTPAVYARYKELGFTFTEMKPPETKPGPPVFTTQASAAEYHRLAQELQAETTTNTKITDDDKKALNSLAQLLVSLGDTYEDFTKRKVRGRLSDRAKKSLDEVIKESP